MRPAAVFRADQAFLTPLRGGGTCKYGSTRSDILVLPSATHNSNCQQRTRRRQETGIGYSLFARLDNTTSESTLMKILLYVHFCFRFREFQNDSGVACPIARHESRSQYQQQTGQRTAISRIRSHGLKRTDL